MSEDNHVKLTAAFLIFMGLMLNGCFQVTHVNEQAIIDEYRLTEGLIEAACIASGGTEMRLGKCDRPQQGD